MTNEPQTGYDNAGHDRGLQVHLRRRRSSALPAGPDGEPPTGDAAIVGRAISDDGSRSSSRATTPSCPRRSSGLMNVFEYEGGEVHLLSPGGGGPRPFSSAPALRRRRLHRDLRRTRSQGKAPSSPSTTPGSTPSVPPQTEAAGCQGENCRGAGYLGGRRSRPPARRPSRRPGRSRSSAPRPSRARRPSCGSWCPGGGESDDRPARA